MIRLLSLCAFLLLVACTGGKPSFKTPPLSGLEFNLEEFFEGKTVAYGQFQDVLGRVSRRFTVEIEGTWDGQVLRLVEDFTYSDGLTEQRIWTLRKTGEQTWEGTAPGVKGLALGMEDGDRFNWRYTIDLPTPDGKTQRVTFNDWMYLLSEDRLLNIAYMQRLGLDLGVVTITFERP